MGLVKVQLISPDLFWECCTYSRLGGENPWILLLFIPGLAAMLGRLISPLMSVYRCVWILPLMANAAGVTEGKFLLFMLFFPLF